MARLLLSFCLILATVLPAQTPPSAPSRARLYDSPYLSIRILPGWTLQPSKNKTDPVPNDCCVLTLAHGSFVLVINPIFEHTSGGIGGRMSDILGGQPSVDAVLGNDDPEHTSDICAQSWETPVTKTITLENLYLDPSNRSGDCRLPFPSQPVWFASFFGGPGPETDFSIALTYNSGKIDALPHKNSPEFAEVLGQTVVMLRTLRLKPPIVITRVVPAAAPPGATVTVYGAGLALPGQDTAAFFRELPTGATLDTQVAPDGKSLTFVVPLSIASVSCPPARTWINEFCLPTPPRHDDANDCPRRPDGRSNFCDTPLPPATYRLAILEEGLTIVSDSVPFTVTPPPPTPVTLRLLYPSQFVSPDDRITLRGRGFTPSGNTVHLGLVLIPDLQSVDGTTLTFPASRANAASRIPVFVSNATGRSNILTLSFR
ncbi:MAG: hypothetical protein WA374_00365 [Acidobacteriaceae bacterium]